MNASTYFLDSYQKATTSLALSSTEVSILMRSTESDLEYAWNDAMIKRASYLIGIHECLQTLVGDGRPEAWVRQSNSYFEGSPAINIMLENDEGLEKVFKYLKAQCVG